MIGWFKDLFKDSLIYGVGFAISRVLQIIVLPIIAHALSLKEYGYYSNYVIFYTIAGGVFMLGLDSSVARFMFDSEEKKHHQKIFSISFFCLLLVSLSFAFVSSFFPLSLMQIINTPPETREVLLYVLFTIPALAINSFLLNWFKWKRQKYYFLINSLCTVLLLLIPLLIVKKLSLLLIFQFIFFSQATVAILSVFLAGNYIRLVFDKKLFLSMIKYGFPWMLVFFLGLSRSYIDRFFLTRYLDDDSYGIYNFSARLSTLITLVTTAFDMSFGPLAFSIWNKEGASRFFSTLQSIYVFILSAVACVIVILSPFLVDILGGPKYRGAEKVLPYLLFSAIPLSLIAFSSMGIIYAKKPFLSTLTLIIGFITVLILNAIFTPTLLQLGAVNSSVIGHLLIVITGYYFSRRYYKVNFNFKKDGLIFLLMFASSIVMVEVQLADNTIEDILMKMLILIIEVIVVTILFFQSEFQKSFTFLKNLYYSNIRGNARV